MSTLSVHGLTRRADLFTLRLFLTVVEERQIRRAAVRENIAPSAATKRIQDLEDIAGVQLFERQPTGMVTSAAGEVLARHLRLLFENLDDMRRELQEFSEGVRGYITIAVTGSIIVQYLAREIGEFSRSFPLVEFDIQQDLNTNVVKGVVAGDADLAVYVASSEIDESGLDVLPYRTNRLVALVPRGHPLAELPEVPFADLMREPFIGIPSSTTLMADLYRGARDLGRPFQPKLTVGTVEAARALVEAGMGVTVQPDCMFPVESVPQVAVVPLADPWAVRPVHIGTRTGRPMTAATRAFIRQLTEQPAPSAES